MMFPRPSERYLDTTSDSEPTAVTNVGRCGCGVAVCR